jgi:hypothetical protein
MARANRIALALILLPFAAFAGDATVSWGEVTQRVDGTPVTISTYRVYFNPDAAPTKADGFVTVTDALTYRFDGLAPATWYFAATALDDDGLESALSAVVSKSIEASPDPLPPVPPDPVIVPGGTQFAYIINQAGGTLALVPVGTVAAGTVCDASQAVRDSNGLTAFRIPDSAVTWSGNVRRSLVFSPCGN